jgi:hypothetical protein
MLFGPDCHSASSPALLRCTYLYSTLVLHGPEPRAHALKGSDNKQKDHLPMQHFNCFLPLTLRAVARLQSTYGPRSI